MEGTAGSFQNASVVRVCTLNACQYLPAKKESKNVIYGCISEEKHSISYLEELESLDVAIYTSTRTICPQRSASMDRGGSKAATPCSAQKSQASQLSVHPSPQKQKNQQWLHMHQEDCMTTNTASNSLTATVHPNKGSKSILLSKWTPWLPAVQWSHLYTLLLPGLMLLKVFISKLTPGELLQLLLQVLRHPENCADHHRAAFQRTREQKRSIRALRGMVLLPTCTVLLKYTCTGGNA